MKDLHIEDIKADNFFLTVSQTGENIIITFQGDVDSREPGETLNPFFDQIHRYMIEENSGNEVVMDLQKLQFMNSSGLKAIARWIMKLSQLPADQSYTIKLIQNKRTTWQVTSLPTLTYLVPGIVKIE